MKKNLTGNWIIVIIGLAFMISTILAIRNNNIIEKHQLTQLQAEFIKQRVQNILSQTMHGLDLGVRGYGLTADNNLLVPYYEAIRETSGNIRVIDSTLAVQNYGGRVKLLALKAEIDNYIKLSKVMIQMADAKQMDQFSAMLREDRGYDVWKKYSDFATPLFAYEDRLQKESLDDYQNAIQSNIVIQIVILVLVMPMLYVFVTKVNNEKKRREKLQQEVDKTDRTYVYNPGESANEHEDVNQRSISHVKQASEFISAIASGNYNVEWQGMARDNAELNKSTLAGNLVNLRDRLKSMKLADERRNWANEGLAQFSEIVRNNSQNQEELAVKCISFLTKAINAQQGSLFVVEGDGEKRHLNLAGCYAFNRKRFIKKRVEIGGCLVGQTYLEGEPVLLTDVPTGYTTITSGLGDATPKCIAIIPMKHEQNNVGVVEFASFHALEEHQLVFLRKAGEYLASAIVSTRTSDRMKHLLSEATAREEEMKQREEELRQNMEELQATQEELVSKSDESSQLTLTKRNQYRSKT